MVVILHASHYATQPGLNSDPLGRCLLFAISKMGIAVPMFFVISGYCIAATSDSTRQKPGSVRQFFIRRFCRIFPPYWIVMFVSVALVAILTGVGQSYLVSDSYASIPHPATLSWSQWVGNITLTEYWRWHFFGNMENKIVGPAWTLCYEEQFYAICGLILVFSKRRFFVWVAIASVLCLGPASVGLSNHKFRAEGLFYDGHWLQFAEGVLVYYLLNYVRSRARGIAIFGFLIGVAITLRWGVPAFRLDSFSRETTFDLVASSVFGLLLLLTHPWDRKLSESRMLGPFRFCGRMCYSLYLVHWPVAVVMTTALYHAGVRGVWPTFAFVTVPTTLVSILLSWVFYQTVERRFISSAATPKALDSRPGSPAENVLEIDLTAKQERPTSVVTDTN